MTQVIEVFFQGSFAPVQKGRYEYLYIIIIITIAVYFYADRLTLAGLGEEFSKNLGVNYKRVILNANILVALATGVVSAVIGNIPFLGLIIPNIISMYRGDNLKGNIPWIAVGSMIVMLLSDIISRIIIAPFELPVSLILGGFGSFIFIYIILRQRGA